ncbi:MAG: universal stress protein [Chloroflexi bacterium]|nr:universal stress protein [Chloroflexota bacterium]
MYEKILVPLDGSQLAEEVLPHVISMASHYNAKVILIQVVLPLYRPWVREVNMSSRDLLQLLHQQAADYLQSQVAQLQAQNIQVRSVILEGQVAETILDFVQKEHIDLIAMSTHGRSGVGRWVFGSVASRILEAAHVPILLIHSARE